MRYMELPIGTRIATWRKVLKLTQGDLADAAKVTISAISHIERETAKPSLDVLEAIVARFGITMETFYGPLPKPPKEAATKTKGGKGARSAAKAGTARAAA